MIGGAPGSQTLLQAPETSSQNPFMHSSLDVHPTQAKLFPAGLQMGVIPPPQPLSARGLLGEHPKQPWPSLQV